MKLPEFRPAARVLLLGIAILAIVAATSGVATLAQGQPRRSQPDRLVTREANLGPTAVNTVSRTTATPLAFAFPSSIPAPVSAWRPAPYPVPWAIRPEDHFFLYRPIASDEVNWPLAWYRYGSTYSGQASIHTGVDLDAEPGTPVLAAGSGEVVWAGVGLFRGYADTQDPYGKAVAIRHDFGYQGKSIYTIYAHMRSIAVWVGQRVEAREKIGQVGTTGKSSGPHLHFEIRLGRNSFYSTRNPELWMVPPEGFAVLAGRIMNSDGYPLEEHMLHIWSLETGGYWQVQTYALDLVNSDDEYHENFAISDLPAGPYEIRVDYGWQEYKAQFFLYPGQTTFITFRGREGYAFEESSNSLSASPPNAK